MDPWIHQQTDNGTRSGLSRADEEFEFQHDEYEYGNVKPWRE